jgi:D-glycero-D-manno-heptose 1,7-bisphosphate phosphatase
MKFIILDRDGVINADSDDYIKSPEEWHPIPGSLEAIATLNQAGFRVLVATNQSGIGRGFYNETMLNRIHEKFMQALKTVGGHVDEIFFCPHHPEEGCVCRKPKPGLFDQIQKKYKLDLSHVYFVGDSITDIQAAEAAGCQSLLVLTGKGQQTLEKNPELAVPYFLNLAQAVSFIIR